MSTRQIFNEHVDITGEVDVHAAVKFLVFAVAVIGQRQKRLSWDAPCVLCPTQFSAAHTTHCLPNWIRKPSLYGWRRHFHNHNGLEKMR